LSTVCQGLGVQWGWGKTLVSLHARGDSGDTFTSKSKVLVMKVLRRKKWSV
jgi:hypothetical protein